MHLSKKVQTFHKYIYNCYGFYDKNISNCCNDGNKNLIVFMNYFWLQNEWKVIFGYSQLKTPLLGVPPDIFSFT